MTNATCCTIRLVIFPQSLIFHIPVHFTYNPVLTRQESELKNAYLSPICTRSAARSEDDQTGQTRQEKTGGGKPVRATAAATAKALTVQQYLSWLVIHTHQVHAQIELNKINRQTFSSSQICCPAAQCTQLQDWEDFVSLGAGWRCHCCSCYGQKKEFGREQQQFQIDPQPFLGKKPHEMSVPKLKSKTFTNGKAHNKQWLDSSYCGSYLVSVLLHGLKERRSVKRDINRSDLEKVCLAIAASGAAAQIDFFFTLMWGSSLQSVRIF